MGKKKKFIDKKKSATFQLMARDTSDPNYSSGPSGDRVFIRVDNNYSYAPDSLFKDDQNDPDSIFADAPDDEDENGVVFRDGMASLPDHMRREILELGFPDDGYNYLAHLREIKQTGGGSFYYDNPKANPRDIPNDVKAYDASRVEVSIVKDEEANDQSVYSVASRTFGARLHKVLDPEVAAMLDDSEGGSDVEDLEEDFVIRANFAERPVDEVLSRKLSLSCDSKVDHLEHHNLGASVTPRIEADLERCNVEKPRARRVLDEQFDLLELQEYGSDGEEEYSGYIDEENECRESLAEKLKDAFKNHPVDGLKLEGGEDIESPEAATDVIHRCKEYAEKYENENSDEDVVFEESSDESEVWDCETIVSTYSTLDNHPAKIGAPEGRRKKKLSEAVFGAHNDTQSSHNDVIALKGKAKLPVDFLPRSKKLASEKIKDEKDMNGLRAGHLNRKPRGQETKEEKKERKSAVKLERREARQMKKEMKGLYKSEAQRAQKVAAVATPSSIHLM